MSAKPTEGGELQTPSRLTKPSSRYLWLAELVGSHRLEPGERALLLARLQDLARH